MSPQLTLEGAILRAGGFGDIPPGASIAEFVYVSLRGGEPPGEAKPHRAGRTARPTPRPTHALRRLTDAASRRFDERDTPYRSLERPMFMRRDAGDYDHLARVKEWSLSAGAADDEEGGE